MIDQTTNIAEPVNPYSLIASPSESSGPIQPVNPSQPQAASLQQPAAVSQPGSAEYMNNEAANPITEPHPLQGHLDNIVNNQHSAKDLLNFEGPDHLKSIATARAGENLNNEMAKQKAVNEIQHMAPTDLAKALTEKTTGGSWTKAIVYGILGMENSAQAEAAKLGIGKHTTVLGPDNKPYLIKVSANGTPLEGYNAETGKKLSPEELVGVAAGSTGNKASDVSLTPHQAVVNGEVHTISTKRTQNGLMYRDDTAGTGWTSQAPAGLTHMGAQDPSHLKGLTAANGVVTKMVKANQDAVGVGGKPIYNQQQIEEARNNAYQTITGKPYGGSSMPSTTSTNVIPTETTTPTTTVAPISPGQSAAQWAESNGIKVHPHGGNRTTQDQANQLAQWYSGGMKGPRPAEVGTSSHEKGTGFDAVDYKDPAVRAKIENAGFVNTVPGEPWHFERKPETAKAKSQAQSILDYDSPPPVGPTTPAKIAIINEVQRLAAEQGKTWDAGQYKIANKTKQDFLTGPQGKTVTAMNTAVNHLDTLQEAGTALHNNQIPLANKITREFAKSFGLPEYTNFEGIKHVVGSEVAKAVAGSGGSALADRQSIEKEFDSANSPDQLNGIIKKYQELMGGQIKSQKQTWTSAGLKPEEFDKKLLPRTMKVINSTEPPTRSKW